MHISKNLKEELDIGRLEKKSISVLSYCPSEQGFNTKYFWLQKNLKHMKRSLENIINLCKLTVLLTVIQIELLLISASYPPHSLLRTRVIFKLIQTLVVFTHV